MKKYIITLTLLAALAPSAVATRISVNSARLIAEKVLKGKTISAPARIKGAAVRADGTPEPYYIFNAGETEGGYVIVAADDCLPAVLGYSPTGTIDAEDAPEALFALLEMSARCTGTSGSMKGATTGTPVVEPLLDDINWGQDTPFNTMCPTLSGGTNAYVGCVATAMAQLMRYYSYPDKGTGMHSYVDGGKTLSADFGATDYDWANMPATVPDNPTAAQIKAYSTLSAHLGVAVDMQYATGGSGAYTHLVAPALRNYFGYSPSLRMHTREYYNTDEWMGMITAELDAKRPVYYSASSEDSAGGHAFVCDGYDSEGYVHINWGWYGRSNGYFYINHLNPGELGAGGGSGAYNISQEILTGLKPAADWDPKNQMLFGATRFSCDIFGSAMTVMTFVENLDTEAFNGELCVVLTDPEEMEVKALVHTQDFTLGGFSSGRPASNMVTLRNVTTATDAEDGTYHIRLGYREKGENAISLLRHPIGLPSHMKCEVRNSMIINGEKHVPTPDATMLTPLAPDGEIYANGSVRFSVDIMNNAADFRLSSLVLTLRSVENPEVTASQTYAVNIYDLSSKNVVMDMDLPENLPAGEYDVILAHDKYPELPFATYDGEPTKVTILPEATTPVLRFTAVPDPYNATTGSTDYKRGDIVYASLMAKNYGAEGDCMLLMRAVDRTDPTRSVVIKAESKNWTKGENSSVKMSNALALDPGNYDCYFYYVTTDGTETLMDAQPVEITMAEADAPAVEVTEFELPASMKQGERYQYAFTVKALKNVSGTVYVRVRQFTYTNGELVYMGSVRLNAGETKTFTGNYRPASTLADGKYLTMVELKEGSTTAPAAGHAVYYRELTIGEENAGTGQILTDDENAATEWFTIEGYRIAEPSAPGLYIRRQGSTVTKVRL